MSVKPPEDFSDFRGGVDAEDVEIHRFSFQPHSSLAKVYDVPNMC